MCSIQRTQRASVISVRSYPEISQPSCLHLWGLRSPDTSNKNLRSRYDHALSSVSAQAPRSWNARLNVGSVSTSGFGWISSLLKLQAKQSHKSLLVHSMHQRCPSQHSCRVIRPAARLAVPLRGMFKKQLDTSDPQIACWKSCCSKD